MFLNLWETSELLQPIVLSIFKQKLYIYISLGRYKSVCLVIMKKLNFSFTVRDLRSKDEFKYINE